MKWMCCILLLLGANLAHADTFVVTSNADSGPNTLREAITKAAANGSAVTDIITFNLPYAQRADRTITISTPFPALSGALIIDGSTQPGSPFGASDARVQITTSVTLNGAALFSAKSCNNISLYGLYVTGVYGSGYIFYFDKVSYVTIGAPGKGNLLNTFYYGIHAEDAGNTSQYYTIQSNLIGTDETGTALSPVVMNEAISFSNISNIFIGGTRTGEGNVISSRYSPLAIRFFSPGNPGAARIFDNKIGTDITGLHPIAGATGGYVIIYGYDDGNVAAPGGTSLLGLGLMNNVIANRVDLSRLASPFSILGNHFGLGIDNAANTGGNFPVTLGITFCSIGTIGDIIPGQENYFANNQTAVNIYYSGEIALAGNIFRCNTTAGVTISWGLSRPKPVVDITTLANGTLGGTALPGSLVELFYNDDCGTVCEGKTFIGLAFADAAGNWTYTGTFSGEIIAIANDTHGASSEFSRAYLANSDVQVTATSCAKNNGAIRNFNTGRATLFHWEDANGNTVGTTKDLSPVAAGTYRLLGDAGTLSCENSSPGITVGSSAGLPSTLNVTVTNAGCDKSTGSLSAPPFDGVTATWTDGNGNVAGTGFTVTGLPLGNYSLQLTATSDATCTASYGPYTISQPGSDGALSLTGLSINPATCSGSNGSILGISYTSTLPPASLYTAWINNEGSVVSEGSFDLTGAPPGVYRLKVKDANSCDTLFSPLYTLAGVGAITLDSSNLVVTPSNACGHPVGAITGMRTENGETFTWTSANGYPPVATLDAQPVFPGTYTLSVSNHYGCTATSLPVMVASAANPDLASFQSEAEAADCNLPSGFVHVANIQNANAYTYRWVSSTAPDVVLSTTLNLDNMYEGVYYLYATDGAGCRELVSSFQFGATPPVSIDISRRLVHNETCGRKDGSISNLYFSGGLTPWTFTWKDEEGNIVSTNPEAINLPAGNYTFILGDIQGCEAQTPPIRVENEVAGLAMPVYRDITIHKGTGTTLAVANFQPGTYTLYGDADLQTPLQQNTTGTFPTGVLEEDKTFYITLSAGLACADVSTSVAVKVATGTYINMPSAFTPNGDGRNDLIKPVINGVFSLESFIIYNRFGNAIFRTAEPAKGWDGTANGKRVDAGTYIWLLRGKDIDGKEVVRKGTVVLIR